MVKIVWTELAIEDLKLIHGYIAKDYAGIVRVHHAARLLRDIHIKK